MTIKEFHSVIKQAYKGRNRDVREAAAMLQIEASELAELFYKSKWYGKEFNKEDVLSEAGDILNFLTYILQFYGVSLEDAMENNKQKLLDRGWIKDE